MKNRVGVVRGLSIIFNIMCLVKGSNENILFKYF
ncbi:hypothetical protein DCAR_0208718 [Daucus carota subsp. sativus]|uniref:Uncharacterized protein n=1 Tax=Daucus carota subsp. sativus TaxID=79200 RepID=A0AAF0WGH1_DAUCS|nr:hypothetical protein DCAR_0208718 [Daucus carota subsp. sativus]